MEAFSTLQLFYIAVLFLIFSVSRGSPTASEQLDNELIEFEARYVRSLDYEHSNNTIKLIGYKKIQVPDEELTEFEAHYNEHHAEWLKILNTYYHCGTSTLHVYFPVEAALLEHDGGVIEANHLGELQLEDLAGDFAVLGRKQTEHVTGVEDNIIKDGIIYLAESNRPHHSFGKVYVYDFGDKVLHGHHHDHRGKRDGKVSCMNNHGGPNCSNKFGIYNGRCTFNSQVCMDYNGWFTDCQDGKTSNFPGSDCFDALAQGHCWNEIM